MQALLRFGTTLRRDPRIEAWFAAADPLREMVQPWFGHMRDCGEDVRETLHDGCPVACVDDAPFGYVNAFRAHAAVGFFRGSALPDPGGLLEGAGRFMRHVKLRRSRAVDEAALRGLIEMACDDMRRRLATGTPHPGGRWT